MCSLKLELRSVSVGTTRHTYHDQNILTPSSACRTLETAKKLSAGVKLATPISVDVTDDAALDKAIGAHDLVISLIPYTFHATVIKSAIRQKKDVVTTSYVLVIGNKCMRDSI